MEELVRVTPDVKPPGTKPLWNPPNKQAHAHQQRQPLSNVPISAHLLARFYPAHLPGAVEQRKHGRYRQQTKHPSPQSPHLAATAARVKERKRRGEGRAEIQTPVDALDDWSAVKRIVDHGRPCPESQHTNAEYVHLPPEVMDVV